MNSLAEIVGRLDGDIVKVDDDAWYNMIAIHIKASMTKHNNSIIDELYRLADKSDDELDAEDLRDESGIVSIFIAKIVGSKLSPEDELDYQLSQRFKEV